MISEKVSYRNVLKATTLIGGSSFISILIGLVRTKFVALLIGPEGVGLVGVLNSLAGIANTVTGMGLHASGVRRIAEAAGKNDGKALSETAAALRRTVILTGLAGMLVTVLSARRLSMMTFGHGSYSAAIAILGVGIFLFTVSSGETCILQGFRNITDLSKIALIGSLSGLCIGVPCYWFLGKAGVAPALVLSYGITLAATRWFSRRIPIVPTVFSTHDWAAHAFPLLRFGFPLMLSSLVATVSIYLIHVYLSRTSGLEAVGLYQASSSLSGVLVNFVLGAMSTDYYPRIAAVSDDNEKIAREVNVQTEISLLLSVPILALTILFMPIAIRVFFSGRFDASVAILRWAVFGIFGRVISWPLSYVILAKGKGGLYLGTELGAAVVHLAAFRICFAVWGLPGAGAAFAILYLLYTATMLILVFRISGVLWKRAVAFQVFTCFLALSALSLLCASRIQPAVKLSAGGVGVMLLTLRSLRRLSFLTGIGAGDFRVLSMLTKKRKVVDP